MKHSGGFRKSTVKTPFSLLIFGILLALAVSLSPPVAAQEGSPSADEVNRVAKGLYCPVCENVPLDVCPTEACVQWRETIRQKLADGWSEAQIREYFAEQYGDRVLATPPARGLNWLVYLLPPLALAVGALIVFRVLRQARPGAARAGASAPALELPPSDADYAAKLEAELARRR